MKKALVVLVLCGLLLPQLSYGQRPLSVTSINEMIITLSNGTMWYVHADYKIPLRYWRFGLSVMISKPHYYKNQYGYLLRPTNSTRVLFAVKLPDLRQEQLQRYLFEKADMSRKNMQDMIWLYFLLKQKEAQESSSKYSSPEKKSEKSPKRKKKREGKVTAISYLSLNKQRIHVECSDGATIRLIVHTTIDNRPSLNQEVIVKRIGDQTFLSFIKNKEKHLIRCEEIR